MSPRLLLPLLLVAAPAAAQTTFTVNSAADPGDGTCDAAECTLREAIAAANAAPGADLVHFDIPGPGVHTIQPASAFPNVVGPVTIDGYTQPGASANTLAVGNDAVLRVEVAGPGSGRYLVLAGTGVVVRGLVINRLGEGLFTAEGSSGHVIAGNFIGTDPTGTLDLGNGTGVYLFRSHTVRIGGTAPADRNVISGNDGEAIAGSDAPDNVVEGNYIGTNAAGTAALGNGGAGFNLGRVFSGSNGSRIGGTAPGAGNVIAGNGGCGVEDGNNLGGIVIQGNRIGTNAAGTAALPNANGVCGASNGTLVGGTTPGAGNVIAGNTNLGVYLLGDNVVIQGNRIGVGADGVTPLGNGAHGVQLSLITGGFFFGGPSLVGGADPGAGNVIAHNGGAGVLVFCCEGAPHTFSGNAVFANGGLGIEIGFANGVPLENDPGDPDGGTNRQQNTPDLLAVGSAPGSMTATYRVDSAPANTAYPLRVEFFRALDGEGAAYLGADTYSEADYTGCGMPPCPKTAAFAPAAPVADGDPVVATATDAAGNTSEFSATPGVVVAGGAGPAAPATPALHPPAPNPAAGAATLRYDLPTAGRVRLAVYDALGREVAVVVDAERAAGRHEAALAAGRLAPGLYLLRLEAGGAARTQRLAVVR